MTTGSHASGEGDAFVTTSLQHEYERTVANPWQVHDHDYQKLTQVTSQDEYDEVNFALTNTNADGTPGTSSIDMSTTVAGFKTTDVYSVTNGQVSDPPPVTVNYGPTVFAAHQWFAPEAYFKQQTTYQQDPAPEPPAVNSYDDMPWWKQRAAPPSQQMANELGIEDPLARWAFTQFLNPGQGTPMELVGIDGLANIGNDGMQIVDNFMTAYTNTADTGAGPIMSAWIGFSTVVSEIGVMDIEEAIEGKTFYGEREMPWWERLFSGVWGLFQVSGFVVGGASFLKGGFGGASAVDDVAVKAMGTRGSRNIVPLTPAQRLQVLEDAKAIGLDPNDIRFFSGSQGTVYSDLLDKIIVGADVFPRGGTPVLGTRSVFDRLTARTVLAHEAGHMMAARNGISFRAGSLMEEFQASVLGARHTPGLALFERFQLLRDAIERARISGVDWRTLRSQLRTLPGG